MNNNNRFIYDKGLSESTSHALIYYVMIAQIQST